MSDVGPLQQIAALRRRLEGRRRTQILELPIPGAAGPYRILAPANPDAVLDELADSFTAKLVAEAAATDLSAADPEPHMPYWATPWASGMALAEAVLASAAAFRGRRVLELGCGLGVTAVAALAAGAQLAVADCFSETLTYCRHNALVNARAAPRTLLADWRRLNGRQLLVRAGPFDHVLAADVLYEPDDVKPLLQLIPPLLAQGGTFWLAEPGRATSAVFLAAAGEAGWAETATEVLERDWAVGAGHARVAVHRFSLTATGALGCGSGPRARKRP